MTTLVLSFLDGSPSFLQIKRPTIKARMSLNFGKIPSLTSELAALERLEKSPQNYNGRNVVTTLVLSILNGSSSFLHTIRTTIKALMSLNFGKIPSLTSELAALERQKN